MRKLLLTTAAVAAAIAGAVAGEPAFGTFTDTRDGKTYKTAVIGGKTWMAQNLNYKTDTSWCYNNSDLYCDDGYGRLYYWKTASTVCPAGWRLPSQKDWDDLGRAAGGKKRLDGEGNINWLGADKTLKAKRGWYDVCGYGGAKPCKSGNGTDDFGFSALPGGARFVDGSFGDFGKCGTWWTSARVNDVAYRREICYDGNSLYEENIWMTNGYSVRCVLDKSEAKQEAEEQDEADYERCEAKPAKYRLEDKITYFTDSRDGRKYRAVKIGVKRWMAENLNYQPKTGNSWCYNDSTSYCDKYGRLYDWKTAKSVCPIGWHLPSHKEWDNLGKSVGCKRKAFSGEVRWYGANMVLKAKNGWNSDERRNGNGNDDYGFSAMPGGLRFPNGGFDGVGEHGFWWAAAEGAIDEFGMYSYLFFDNKYDKFCGADGRAITSFLGYMYETALDVDGKNGNGGSVRCVQDGK